MTAAARPLWRDPPDPLPVGQALINIAASMGETALMMDRYETHVAALIEQLGTLPSSIDGLQQLDQISQTLRGLAILVQRAGDAVPQEVITSRSELFDGIGLGALVTRVEGQATDQDDLPDSGEFEAF